MLVLDAADYVVNKRYKYYGVVLCFLSVASFAVEIVNIALTFSGNLKDSNGVAISKPFEVPYILTCIAAGVWGSIPVSTSYILCYRFTYA